MDEATVKGILALEYGSDVTWYTPLKAGDLLIKWGVAPDRMVQLDWHQGHTLSIRGVDVETICVSA
jgi:L-ascorbate metabolism protein UlaG (beta-lactamase superfamily)